MVASPSRLKAIFVAGASVLALTGLVFLFFLGAASGTRLLALAVLLSAEMVGLFALSVVEGDLLGVSSSLFRLGGYVSTLAYFLLSLILAVLFIWLNPENSGWFFGLEAGLLGLLVGVAALFIVLGRGGSKADSLAESRDEAILDLKARLSAIIERLPASPLRDRAKKIADDFRYFNRSAGEELEADLSQKIDELDKATPANGEALPPEVGALLLEIAALTKKREEAGRIAKKGGF
ncbi:MAG: hypothetical protein LBI10_02095 [Deltaproteobacteria bacterium]|jgi:hypothetical protein|nr:hypothetical protein [Deltaproteobacteria bacterium]